MALSGGAASNLGIRNAVPADLPKPCYLLAYPLGERCINFGQMVYRGSWAVQRLLDAHEQVEHARRLADSRIDG